MLLTKTIVWRGPMALLGKTTYDRRRLAADGTWTLRRRASGAGITPVFLLSANGDRPVVGILKSIFFHFTGAEGEIIGELELDPDALARCPRPTDSLYPQVELVDVSVDSDTQPSPSPEADDYVMDLRAGEIMAVALGHSPCWPELRPVLGLEQIGQIWR